MATAIGFYNGEGSNPAELAHNKELASVRVAFGAPFDEVREALALEFLMNRMPAIANDADLFEYSKYMVLVSVIDDDGGVYNETEYLHAINE